MSRKRRTTLILVLVGLPLTVCCTYALSPSSDPMTLAIVEVGFLFLLLFVVVGTRRFITPSRRASR